MSLCSGNVNLTTHQPSSIIIRVTAIMYRLQCIQLIMEIIIAHLYFYHATNAFWDFQMRIKDDIKPE